MRTHQWIHKAAGHETIQRNQLHFYTLFSGKHIRKQKDISSDTEDNMMLKDKIKGIELKKK